MVRPAVAAALGELVAPVHSTFLRPMDPAGLPLPLPQLPITRVLLAPIFQSSGPDATKSYFPLGLGHVAWSKRSDHSGWLQ
jgi:hypothetical protein